MCIFPEHAAFFILNGFFYTYAAVSSLCLRQVHGEWEKTLLSFEKKRRNFQPFLKKKLSTFLYLKISQAFFFGNDSMVIADSGCEPGSPYGGKDSRLGMVDQS